MIDVKEMPGSKPENPLWMSWASTNKPKLKDVVLVMAISVAPVVLAILMQKPALRQEIQMRFFHSSRIVSQHAADFFQLIATKSAQEYQKARL